MGLLNDLSSVAGGVADTLQTVQDVTGFTVPPIPGADGNGLPSQKVPSQRAGTTTRNLAHWFVPEVGIVPMFINPRQIRYNNKKLITKQRTKGGWVAQYWGEELTTLNIDGTTGTSGIEGINVLYEIYRAEQYLFDPIALTMAADSSVSGLNDLIDQAAGNLGGLGSSVLNATSGLLGLDPTSQNILPRDIPSLSAQALGVELYYSGWVFRGWFDNFDFTESADKLGMFDYNFAFVVTQRRGYRLNYLGWHHSAISGPSDWKGVPLSFGGLDPSNLTKQLINGQ
jgi:hypothetical protein